MENLVGNNIGLLHLISSIISLITGTIILSAKKGSRFHKRVGYIYFVSMTLTNITAFMIYRLYGSFGIFHIAAVFSILTTYAGIIPVWLKRPLGKWKFYHFTFMYWSVIGLYMALVAEILTRFPDTSFLGMVGISMLLVGILGLYFFKKHKPRWVALLKIQPKH